MCNTRRYGKSLPRSLPLPPFPNSCSVIGQLSAMEDFIGRGDRSLGRVILRAWQLGATNDAW